MHEINPPASHFQFVSSANLALLLVVTDDLLICKNSPIMSCVVWPAGGKESVTHGPPFTPWHCSRSPSGQSSRAYSIIQAQSWRAGTRMSHTMKKHTTLNSSQALTAHHQLPTGNEPKWPDMSRERWIKCRRKWEQSRGYLGLRWIIYPHLMFI